jgi:hypothetical protein
VSAPVDWQSGFLATSVLLGEPLETALACIAGRESAGARELARELASPDRASRARVVARVTTALLASLDAAGVS